MVQAQGQAKAKALGFKAKAKTNKKYVLSQAKPRDGAINLNKQLIISI